MICRWWISTVSLPAGGRWSICRRSISKVNLPSRSGCLLTGTNPIGLPSFTAVMPLTGHDASEPVAQGSDKKTAYRICRCRQYRKIQCVGTEREDRRCQKSSYEKAEQAKSFKPFHVYFLLFLKNSVTMFPHSSARTPETTSVLGCSREGENIEYPRLGSDAPYTTFPI